VMARTRRGEREERSRERERTRLREQERERALANTRVRSGPSNLGQGGSSCLGVRRWKQLGRWVLRVYSEHWPI